MVSGAKRLVGSGIAYLLFGVLMLYVGLSAWGIIQSKDFPKGNFMAILSTALGIFDVIVGTRKLFAWGGACPYCGYSKVSLFGDVTSVYCRACKRKIIRKGPFFYRAE
ncbi:MAG: hypothetical protein WCO26_02470 [Deltaproteobacteria bacterium]